MKTVIVDTSNLGYIAYHSSKNKSLNSMIFGILTNLILISNKFKTNKFIWAIDSYYSYRKQLNSTYKGNRTFSYDREVVHQQLNYFTEIVLKDLGFINVVKVRGYEADDVIAGYAKKLTRCIIASNDHDFFQCLSKSTDIYDVRGRHTMTTMSLQEQYNVSPKQWKLVKAIGGCSSDRVTGVPGIGEKTAIQYLNNTLNSNSDKYRKIQEGKALIRSSLKLVSLPFNKQIKLPGIKKDKISEALFGNVFKKYKINSLFTKRWERFVSL